MNRAGSNDSRHLVRSHQLNPFTGDGGAVQIPLLPTVAASPSTIDSWANSPEDPYNSFAQHTHMRRSDSRKQSNQDYGPDIPAPSVGEDPAAFFAARNMPAFKAPSFSINPPLMASPVELPMHATNYSYNQPEAASSSNSLTPTMTTGTTFTSGEGMSRQNSSRTEAALGGVAMMAINSNMSAYSTASYDDYQQHDKSFPNVDQTQMLLGAGGITGSSQMQASHSQSIAMDRSESSSSSSSSRSREQLQRVNQHAAIRPIKPKSDDKPAQSANRKNSSSSATKPIAISKTSTYVRPRREPMKCDLCNDKPEGYRGPHELNRHKLRAHTPVVKRWKCVDPQGSLPKDAPVPVKALAKCKACSEGKSYGIDYNAAAHLRRAHFNPKQKSKGRSNKSEKDKKAAKSGGDWPKMEHLRPWLEETRDENNGINAQDDDDDCDNDFDIENFNSMLDEEYSRTVEPVINGSFSASAVDTLDAYPTPVSSKGFEMSISQSHNGGLQHNYSPTPMASQTMQRSDSGYVTQMQPQLSQQGQCLQDMPAAIPMSMQMANSMYQDPTMGLYASSSMLNAVPLMDMSQFQVDGSLPNDFYLQNYIPSETSFAM